MKSRIMTTLAAIFAAAIAFAQPNCKLRPDETILLYSETFDVKTDVVHGKVSHARFEMAEPNKLSGQ